MAKKETYLVPVDFSAGSDRAFDYALRLARARSAQLVALHVVPGELIYPPAGGRIDFYAMLERDARKKFDRLAKRKGVKPRECALLLGRGAGFADEIIKVAKKLRVAMIIMGSHGRTGLPRLLIGSVAERTLRYARCPVLIVK
jgi:nucleotide-binding universal stress UspA family protein